MRSRRIQHLSLPFLFALALLALALVAAQSMAGHSGSSRSTLLDVAKKRSLSYTVVERPITDSPAVTPARGDLLTFANPIYNAANRTQIGTDEGTCTRTRVGVASYCDFVVTLSRGPHKGRVVVAGAFYDDTKKTSTFVVTGGTGAFAHAAGPMRLTTRADGNYDFRFKLTY